MLIKRKKHSVPSLNTTSTADISFMLLTFFLVTSSMDVDRGLVRQLPPLDKEEQTDRTKDVAKENTLAFRITAQNKVILNDESIAATDVRRRIADFVRLRGAQHLIIVDADPASDYNTYFNLENEIVAAYAEVRNVEASAASTATMPAALRKSARRCAIYIRNIYQKLTILLSPHRKPIRRKEEPQNDTPTH